MASDTAASCLLDVVVLAGGDSQKLTPLCAEEPKTMLRLCNRPLIWYCLAPWIEAGFRAFFLCVNEDYATLRTYLSRAFDGIDFHFIFVPSNVGDHASTTCDAVRAYLKYKEALRHGEQDTIVEVPGGAADREDSTTAFDNSTTAASGGGGGSSIRSPHTASLSEPLPHRGTTSGARHHHHHHHHHGSGGGGGGSGRDPLELERISSAGLPRDAVLLSCDTVLVDVDLADFVERHYASLASATVMLYRPLRRRTVATAGAAAAAGAPRKSKGGGGGASAPAEPSPTPYTHALCCAAYEEEDALASMALGATTAHSASAASHSRRVPGGLPARPPPAVPGAGGRSPCDTRHPATGEPARVHHRRLHYLNAMDGRPEVRITMAFAARRPDLTFAADVVDAHVYLLHRWVLEFAAESAGLADVSVRKDILPLLARSQHTTINASEKVFVTPAEKLKVTLPSHWLGDGAGISARSLSAARGPVLPEEVDSLRVFATIYEEDPDLACRIHRMNTRDSYHALHHDIISAKCFQLRLEEQPRGTGGGAAAVRASLPSLLPHGGAVAAPDHGDSGRSVPSAGAMALAALVPDNPITVREKIGDQQVYIVGSFVDSVPPPNVFVTRSVIGAHVTLSPGARITDSVLMGNVEIGANAVVARSVIGTGAVVNAGCRLVGTIVAPRCVVEENATDSIIE